MAEYRIAEANTGEFFVVKVTGKGGRKAVIMPPVAKMVYKAFCNSVDDIVRLESFEEIKSAHPNSMGAFVRTST